MLEKNDDQGDLQVCFHVKDVMSTQSLAPLEGNYSKCLQTHLSMGCNKCDL